MLLLLLLLFSMLLYEVIIPKSWAIKVSSQTVTYFGPGSQGALQNMLCYWARAKRNTVRQWEQHEDDYQGHQ